MSGTQWPEGKRGVYSFGKQELSARLQCARTLGLHSDQQCDQVPPHSFPFI